MRVAVFMCDRNGWNGTIFLSSWTTRVVHPGGTIFASAHTSARRPHACDIDHDRRRRVRPGRLLVRARAKAAPDSSDPRRCGRYAAGPTPHRGHFRGGRVSRLRVRLWRYRLDAHEHRSGAVDGDPRPGALLRRARASQERAQRRVQRLRHRRYRHPRASLPRQKRFHPSPTRSCRSSRVSAHAALPAEKRTAPTRRFGSCGATRSRSATSRWKRADTTSTRFSDPLPTGASPASPSSRRLATTPRPSSSRFTACSPA